MSQRNRNEAIKNIAENNAATIKRLSEATEYRILPQAEAWGFDIIVRSPT